MVESLSSNMVQKNEIIMVSPITPHVIKLPEKADNYLRIQKEIRNVTRILTEVLTLALVKKAEKKVKLEKVASA